MVNLINSQYAVFGHPIKHSLSPMIHTLFLEDMKIDQTYIAIDTSIRNLEKYLTKFFENCGKGANITLPFKKRAFLYSNLLTTTARESNSVNTLKKVKNGLILGDNTDGIGLLDDLKRLKFIHSDSTVLILGAGGAAHAVVPELLRFGCNIFIYNRTFINAKNMVLKFKHLGKLDLISDPLILKNQHFDLIINATSSSMYNTIPNIPTYFVNSNTFCYDMYYLINKLTFFLIWCKKNGAIHVADGLGMLVSQAAYSFRLWHNKFPNIKNIMNKLRIM